ncbi:MAG: hypothetical protein ABH835_02960 [Patescibacteria group bacterium]
MKKIIGGLTIISILLILPLATFAYSIDDAKKDFKNTTSEIMASFKKFTNLNVTGKIVNKKGVLKLSDKVNVSKRLKLNTNLDVRGTIKNNDSGEEVKIADDFKVDGITTLEGGAITNTVDFSQTNTSALTLTDLNGGNIYYGTDTKLYVYNGTSLVDLTQQNTDTNTTYTASTGVTLTDTAFSINQGFSPTWTGTHTWEENMTLNKDTARFYFTPETAGDSSYNFTLGNDGSGDDDDNFFIYTSYPDTNITINPIGSINTASGVMLATGGGNKTPALSIATGGCATPDEVQLDGSPTLSTIYPGDVFLDEVGTRFSISSIDDDTDLLSIDGTCTQDGSNDARVQRNDFVASGGKSGIGTVTPYADFEVNNHFKLTPTATPPETCTDIGIEGSMYYDSDLNLPCVCNGTNWLQMDDFVSVCS